MKNRNVLLEKAKKENIAMNYHNILLLIEIFLAFRSIMDFVTTFMNPYSVERTVDQVMYVLMTVVLVYAILRHDYRKGIIALYVFMALELIMACMVYIVAGIKGIGMYMLDEKMWSLIIGSLFWFGVTFVYYRKRWRLLA